MKSGKVLLTGIIFGIILFSTFSLLDINTIYGGIVGAILVGIIVGKITDKNPIKYAAISIFIYNVIGWAIIFLFTPEGMIVLGHESAATSIFIGFIMILIIFYSVIGSFSAFATYNLKTDKQD
ncbi:hypothetical protein [Methanococcoides seepicolus]|uniref:Uncharacterized protein n=1 Tax=Methanococcoides seepicolus TaxID=2828780 RepID=A0A9E4ZIX8_9EURY|nr:hypothetical protein [Methanococcoides seepicolus]MCM1987683.1 hypothetical protein [Methanococcoides seepicolus]